MKQVEVDSVPTVLCLSSVLLLEVLGRRSKLLPLQSKSPEQRDESEPCSLQVEG